MYSTKIDNNINSLKVGYTLLDTKFNINKYKSDKSLQNIICNQFNKTLITGVTSMVTNESLITNSVKEKNNIKRKLGIYSEINQDYIDAFIDNKNRVFNALENLLINDDVNNDMNNSNIKDKNNHVNNNNSDNNSSTNELKNFRHSKSKKKKKKHKKHVSVPKLNFTEIFKKYEKRPLKIQEVKYESKFNDDSINNNWKNIKIENNYHLRKKSKKNKKLKYF